MVKDLERLTLHEGILCHADGTPVRDYLTLGIGVVTHGSNKFVEELTKLVKDDYAGTNAVLIGDGSMVRSIASGKFEPFNHNTPVAFYQV